MKPREEDLISNNIKPNETLTPTAYYRVKRLESMGLIKSYGAILDPEKLGFEYITITLVRGRYGKGYHEKIGEMIASYPYVQSVYFVLGDIDFVVMAKFPSREHFMRFLESMINPQKSRGHRHS
jgi:DNA-binding Lrp family transcriptional regulator